MNADGTEVRKLTDDRADDQNPAWSPDGTKIAWKRDRTGADQLLVMNADGSTVTQLVTGTTGGDEVSKGYRDWSPDGSPAWSPDGTKISFSSKRTDNTEIFIMNVDGSGMMKLTDHRANDDEPAWQPRRPEPPVATVSPVLPPTT